jgi:long-chain acyl-CoA synthetase
LILKGKRAGLMNKEQTKGNSYKDWSDIIELNGRNLKDKVYVDSLDQGRQITFGEMNEYCNRIGGFLREKQVKPGDTITLIGKNTIETLIIYFGILKYGAIANPVFFEESEENLHRIINMTKPKVLFCESGRGLDKTRYRACEWIEFSDYGQTQGQGSDFFQRLSAYSSSPGGYIPRKTDVAVILYTSGTTEIPKGIHISREGLYLMVDEISDRTGMTGDDRVLEYRAYNWASAQLLTVLSCMLKGATLFLANKFSRSRFPGWLKEQRITISSGVPAVINMLVNEPVALSRDEVPWLKYITSSSAPLSVESHLRFEELYGISIQQMMGMTEAGWMAGNPPGRRKVGSVGLPLKHKEIRFVNDRGELCLPEEVGEMIVSGRAMGLCYSKEDGSIEMFPDEGFPTGDLGYRDAEGYIYITGRKKDLIIRGGINISPREITARILEHPGVHDAATIGVPDKIYGEEVVSFVVAKGGSSVDEGEIIRYCETSLPKFKTPKKVLIVPEIPKTQRGKISKADMLKLYESRPKEGEQGQVSRNFCMKEE